MSIYRDAFSENMILLSYCIQSINTDWPNGRAWYVLEKIQKKFERTDMIGDLQRDKLLSEIILDF